MAGIQPLGDGDPARQAERLMRRWLRLRGDARLTDADLRAELEAHLALATDHFAALGHPRAEAERLARARFPDFERSLAMLSRTAAQRTSIMIRRELWQDAVQDGRLALRQCRRAPGFFAAMVATLAIGLGANAAVFSILQSTLLRPLPYREPDRLAMIWDASRKNLSERGLLTPPAVLAWHDALTKELGDIAAVMSWQGNPEAAVDYVTETGAERLNGALVSPNFFEVLGVTALRGRVFTAADEQRGDPLVVLSYAVWQRVFGGEQSVVGRPVTLTLGRRDRAPKSYVVAGVLPPDVHFTYPVETEVWLLAPWSSVRAYPANGIAYQAVARLAPGVTMEGLARRLETYRAGLDYPEFHLVDDIISPQPVREWVLGDTRPSLDLMAVVSVLLFVVTCVTVANGMLARVSQRQQELAVRSAIGASRWRLTRQLVSEGGLLALCGAIAGVAAAALAHPLLRQLLPASVPRIGDLASGTRLMLFGLGAATLTTLVAAVVPSIVGAVTQSPALLVRASAGASAGPNALRMRHWLIGVQAAVATTLLVCATLLIASFWRLGHVPLGFNGDRVVTVEMRLLGPTRSAATVETFRRTLADAARALPGVVDVGVTTAVPFRGVDFMMRLPAPGAEKGILANRRSVDPGFFRVLRLPLVRGRYLMDSDDAQSMHVGVVSQSLARALFGSTNPIGQRIQLKEPVEIVGVVADARYVSPTDDARPAFYLPLAQSPSELLCLVLQSKLPLERIAPAIRATVHRIDPTVPVMRATTVDRIVDDSVASRRFYTVMTGAFAGIAILLTLGGLIAVVARVVAERRRELAIRIALGASLSNVAQRASRDSVSAAALGILAGLVSAYALASALSQFLFEIDARSMPTYIAVGVSLLLVAGLAAWHPLRRLSRLPVSALLRAD